MARLCQESLRFPYYDLVVAEELHLTLDRIGDEDQLSPTQLSAIQENAHAMCEQVAPFSVAIGSLTGTAGAVGFSVSPREPIAALRDVLRSATLSGGENVRPKEGAFHAHVAIAYANAEVDPAAAIEAVVRLHSIPPVRVAVTQAQLVLLERQRGSYAWQPIAPVRLRGALGPELREDTGIYGDRPAHTSRVGDT
ncbi:2'-5' RNA ligase family protein [Actinoplanes sp. NPDC051346]|uniref:2'-5' RNA ligase family protein n=1 Tax=Actinoplanes sp. NPDC051346 TaxID=3155048 RepID=UPI003412832B